MGYSLDELKSLLPPVPEKELRRASRQRSDLVIAKRADDAARNRAIRWLDKRDGGVDGKCGNHWTYRTAEHIMDFGFLPDETFTLLKEHWNQKCKPPWSDAELYEIVDHAAAYKQNAIGCRLLEKNVEVKTMTQQEPSTHISHLYRPFPLDVLPEPIQGFVRAAAESVDCDAGYVAPPLLAALAAAIGAGRRIQLKRDWHEPAIIWAAIVGDSGTKKSPALEQALRFVDKAQDRESATYRRTHEQYRHDSEEHKATNAERRKTGKDPLPAPEKPIPTTYYVSDTTVEALAVRLAENPRGLLLRRDELDGWLRSFGQYKNGAGGDVSQWLEMWGSRPLRIDRKGGEPIYIQRASVSITGGIQPGTLRRALGEDHRENGLTARLLLVMPPKRVKKWTNTEIDSAVCDELYRVFRHLYSIPPGERNIGLSPAAKKMWIEFVNRHGVALAEVSGETAAIWAKAEAYAARFSLILHCVQQAAVHATEHATQSQGTPLAAIEVGSVQAGIRLAEWFTAETLRVHCILRESDQDRELRELAEWIGCQGGDHGTRTSTQGSIPISTRQGRCRERIDRTGRARGWRMGRGRDPNVRFKEGPTSTEAIRSARRTVCDTNQ